MVQHPLDSEYGPVIRGVSEVRASPACVPDLHQQGRGETVGFAVSVPFGLAELPGVQLGADHGEGEDGAEGGEGTGTEEGRVEDGGNQTQNR